MASHPHPPGTLEREPDWTTRQREVLDLLVKGWTNVEIADHFGISLDGAKWHVREIMAKLDVSSREEAAAYWRARNTTGARLRRSFAGLAMLSRVGTVARIVLGASLLTAGVAIFAGVLLLAHHNDDTNENAAASSSTTTASATMTTATASPAVTTTAVSAPSETSQPIATLNGVPVYQLVPTDVDTGRSLPQGSVLYYTESCCNNANLYRFRQDAGGHWISEPLLIDNQPGLPAGYPFAPMASDGNGRFAVTWCLTDLGVCGKRHDGTADDTPRALLQSDDGGVTWKNLRQLPALSSVAGFDGGDVVVGTRARPAVTDITYIGYPSGRTVEAPSTELNFGGLALQRVVPDSAESLGNDTSSVYSVSGSGQQQKYVAFVAGNLSIGAAISPTLLLGNAERSSKAMLIDPPTELGGLGRLPVIVDLKALTVSPIAGLTPPEPNAFVNPITFNASPVWRVTNASDCLNVRERPDIAAPVIACFADNVLLGDGGQKTTSGDTTWLAVTTPAGVAGWASSEFLAR